MDAFFLQTFLSALYMNVFSFSQYVTKASIYSDGGILT